MLTQKIKRDIKEHATKSLYRMNCSSADCYIFDIVKDNGKQDFSGGWDWRLNPIDKKSKYIYDIKQDLFIKRF